MRCILVVILFCMDLLYNHWFVTVRFFYDKVWKDINQQAMLSDLSIPKHFFISEKSYILDS